MSHALEICIACDDAPSGVRNALAAVEGGADRLECCADMAAGGLTPSPATIEAISRRIADEAEILVMVRPRDGDFVWTPEELNRMESSIQAMAAAGAHGIVSGALLDHGVDEAATRRLIDAARTHGMPFTFHRAIDAVAHRAAAVQKTIRLGANRILTAGTVWGTAEGAVQGLPNLQALSRLMQDSLELVVGGGVSAETLPVLANAFQGQEKVSFHAYSSVLSGGITDAGKVRDLKAVLS